MGYEDDLNFYQYVGNDPLNRSDPTGRQERRRYGPRWDPFFSDNPWRPGSQANQGWIEDMKYDFQTWLDVFSITRRMKKRLRGRLSRMV